MQNNLNEEQIITLQAKLNALGFPCSDNGILTGSTIRAWRKYYTSICENCPDIYSITELPELRAN